MGRGQQSLLRYYFKFPPDNAISEVDAAFCAFMIMKALKKLELAPTIPLARSIGTGQDHLNRANSRLR